MHALLMTVAAAAAVASTATAAAAATAAPPAPKHILFLMIDDLGFNDISYRNTSDLSSPNIDALALAGIRLERYYTHNLCSPSRTSFLSGRYASTLSMQGCVIVNGHAIDLPSNVSTVADRLGKGGWKRCEPHVPLHGVCAAGWRSQRVLLVLAALPSESGMLG
jgi:hypothetical protein